MNIVLDTNCLLMSLSRRSAYYPVWRDFVDGKYTLCVTNEILAEYEEILTHAKCLTLEQGGSPPVRVTS